MNKSTFRDDLSDYIRGHDEKHCTFQNVRYRTYLTNSEYPSIHRIIEINKREILSIIKIMSCLRLFVNSFLTDW